MGASCNGCPYYKISRQYVMGTGGKYETFHDCKAIDTAPRELSLRIEEYFRGNSSGSCPLFEDES